MLRKFGPWFLCFAVALLFSGGFGWILQAPAKAYETSVYPDPLPYVIGAGLVMLVLGILIVRFTKPAAPVTSHAG